MTNLDLICAADDQHRVALLADLLAQSLGIADWTVTVRQAPPARPASPLIVAWTARAREVPAIAGLFDDGAGIVVACLDDTPLPGPCLRAVRLQRWPARSADRKVVALARWLRRPGVVRAPEAHAVTGHEPDGSSAGRSASATAGAASPGGLSAGKRAPPGRPGLGIGDRASALALIGLVVVGGVLLAAAEPASRQGAAPQEPPEETVLEPTDSGSRERPGETPQGTEAGVDSADADGLDPSAGQTPEVSSAATQPGVPARAAAGTAIRPAGPGPGVASAPASDLAPAPGPDDVRPAPVQPTARDRVRTVSAPAGAAAGSDALSRLCAAATPAAARAWSQALDWKQRRRAPSEPCVRALLARPAFAGLTDAIAPR